MRTPTRLAVCFLACCLATLSGIASAAESLVHLSWNDCSSMPGAATNVDYACNGTRHGTAFKLVMSFVAPADLTAFVGVQASIDITGEANSGYPPAVPLPNWWRLATGECRAGNLQFPLSLDGIGTGASGACRNPWLGAVTGGGYLVCTESHCDPYSSTRPGWARIKLALARDSETQLIAGQEYVVGVVGIDTWKDQDVGDGACEGCCTPMRLEPVVVELYQTAGTAPQDNYYLYGTEDALGRSSGLTVQPVHWQQGGATCQAVPAIRSTWGSIKSSYR
jgi:hypothetical protein